MGDDERPSFSLGRRPYKVEHDPDAKVPTPPGWRGAQARVIAAVLIVALLVFSLVYAVVTAGV